MAQNVNRLYKHRNTFYYRVRIPRDLLRFFAGKEDVKRSLRTKSLKQARRLLREVMEMLRISGMTLWRMEKAGIITPIIRRDGKRTPNQRGLVFYTDKQVF